jgi:uncharacterized protein
MDDFKRKVALITGASSGIGAALARELGNRGAHIVLLARRREKLETVARNIEKAGIRALAIPCDVTKPEAVKQAVIRVQQEFAKVDLVVVNAGFGVVGNFEALNEDDYRRQFETNLFGAIHTIDATLDHLKASRGRLAVIGSVHSYIALPGNSAYSMSKYALRALCESLRHELRTYGVSVTHICPGYVATELRQVDNRGVCHPEVLDPAPRRLLISADEAARRMLRAIARRSDEQAITLHGKLAIALKRYAPSVLSALISAFQIKARPKPET